MKVFTYFEPVQDIRPDNTLMQLWRESWMRHGWEPVILGRRDAVEVDAALVAQIEGSKELQRGPCPPGYNLACHLRWVAHSAEGGLLVDYDLMNRGFTPDDLAQFKYLGSPVFLTGNNCPCAVYADQGGVEAMLGAIILHARQVDGGEWDPLAYPGELQFVAHDQAIFHRFSFRWRYPKSPLVGEYRADNEEWRQYPLVHFPNETTPKPRGGYILRNNLIS